MSLQQASKPAMTLFRGWLDKGQYVWSPFVTKVEFHLRLSDVTYTIDAGSPSKAPKGKIPFIDLGPGYDPSQVGDSTLIIQHLIELNQVEDLNAALSPAQRFQDLAIRALFEDKLYFYHTRERWIQNYPIQRDKALWSMSYPLRLIIGLLIYRGQVQMLHGQGTGRYNDEEIAAFRAKIWHSLSDMLEVSWTEAKRRMRAKDEPFWVLGGENPTEADATVFGFVTSVLIATSGPDSNKLVKSLPVVMDYAGRIHDRYFPDYVKWDE